MSERARTMFTIPDMDKHMSVFYGTDQLLDIREEHRGISYIIKLLMEREMRQVNEDLERKTDKREVGKEDTG